MTDIITDFAAIAKLARFRDTPPQSEEVHTVEPLDYRWPKKAQGFLPSYLEQSDDGRLLTESA